MRSNLIIASITGGTTLIILTALLSSMYAQIELLHIHVLDQDTGKYPEKYYEHKYINEPISSITTFTMIGGIVLLFIGVAIFMKD